MKSSNSNKTVAPNKAHGAKVVTGSTSAVRAGLSGKKNAGGDGTKVTT
jgi:hypothetical protein